MHRFPRCFVFSLSLIAIWGCETKHIGYRDSPDHYDALKRIECEILYSSPNKATTQGLMTIPDHFGFRQALKAYEGNFFNTCDSSVPDISCLSGSSCVTGLIRQALMDGILDRDPDSIAAVIDRDEKRRRLQSEFWRDNYGLTNRVALPYGFPVKTNAYARLSASYEYGYRNASGVVSKLNRSPIPAGYYCAPPKLGANPERRAYVYGWYVGCYDFFDTHPELCSGQLQTGMDPRLFYRNWITEFSTQEALSIACCSLMQLQAKEQTKNR